MRLELNTLEFGGARQNRVVSKGYLRCHPRSARFANGEVPGNARFIHQRSINFSAPIGSVGWSSPTTIADPSRHRLLFVVKRFTDTKDHLTW